jgi:multidrug efflux system membrane fusion protein
VQPGQNEQFVFVVQPDQTVGYRAVTVSRIFDGQAVIDQGLKAGETVVTDGHLRLAPGARVAVKLVVSGQ